MSIDLKNYKWPVWETLRKSAEALGRQGRRQAIKKTNPENKISNMKTTKGDKP